MPKEEVNSCEEIFPEHETVQKALWVLESLHFDEENVILDFTDKDWLDAASRQGLIRDIEIEAFLHKALIKAGRLNYKQHINGCDSRIRAIWPDQMLSPHAFAYALAERAFSTEELSKIYFGHGDVDGFIYTYGGEIFQKTLKKLCQRKSGGIRVEFY